MHQRAIETALALTWTLGACQRQEPTVAPNGDDKGPGAIAEVDGAGGQLPIVLVEQQVPHDSMSWTFDPSGHRLASTELDDCSIWDIESGKLIRSYEQIDAVPCTEWPTVAMLHDFNRIDSADEQLSTAVGNNGLDIVELASGKVRKTLACKDCESAEYSTWSPTGHQLAFAWADPARLEIWDADTGQRLSAQAIPIADELTEMEIGWTEAGATLAWSERGFPVECEGYEYDCEYDQATGKSWRVPVASHIMVVTPKGAIVHDVGHDGQSIGDLTFGPMGHWVMWTWEWSERRGGTTIETHFANLSNKGDTAGWSYYSEYESYGGYQYDQYGQWHDDGFSHYAVQIIQNDYEGNTLELSWRTTVYDPPLGRRSGKLLDEIPEASVVEVELYGLIEQGITFTGTACNQDEVCKDVGPVLPPDCEVVDIASGHGAVLLECGTSTFLSNNTGAPINLQIDPTAMDWWWGRGGSLALFDGASFVLLDTATGKANRRKDITAMIAPSLGPEHDRLVLVTQTGAELIDMNTGQAVLKLPGGDADWAVSPTGDRIAYITGDQLRVLALPSGEQLASWTVSAPSLAFRQDGKVIFVGNEVPEQAYDASTGQLVSALDWVFEKLDAGGELDGNWLWIVNAEADEVTRTLDGLTLAWTHDGAYLPSTGQFVGSGLPLGAFKIGNDPWGVPRFGVEDLRKWLVRDDLVEAFLTGKPIPKPTISAGEAQGLEAIARGKSNGG
jgi:hypothetical protein